MPSFCLPSADSAPKLKRRARLRVLAGAWVCLALLSACNDPGSRDSSNPAASPQADGIKRPLAAPAGWVSLPSEPDASLQGLNIPADAPTRGMWSGSKPWPFNAIHAVMLSDGRVLTFGTLYGIADSQDGRFFDVWTPELGFGDDAHAGNVTPDAVNSFCGSVGWLADGSLLVAGGNGGGGSPLFGKTTGTFSMSSYTTTQNGANFAAERWYSTMLALPDTRQIILGGTVPYASPITSHTPEILENGAWRSLFGASSTAIFGVRALGNQPEANPWYYPRAWVAPDGNVFGITSNIMFRLDPNANNRTGSIQQIGTFKTVQDGSGVTTPNVGFTSTAVMYAPGRILQVGGNGTTDNNGLTASQNASVIDINGPTPVVTETAPMSFRRHWANSVVLPDGKVVVTGGTTVGWDPANAVRAAEIWNPDTGTWTVGASAVETRTYHSSSVLLPSGAVFTSGGGAPGAVNNRNTELYYPPYLFTTVNGQAQLAARPRIASISALQGNWGGTLGLELAAAGGVSKVVLIQTGTTTHSFDSSQRLVPLTFTQNGTMLTANIPANANLAPPGYYMVFVVDAAGVPSRGVMISLGGLRAPPATRPNIPSALPSNAVLCAQENGTCTLPGGLRGTVYYGARGIFASRAGVTGSLACNNAVLGDPVAVVKQCFYVPEGPAGGRYCAAEGGGCTVAPGFTANLSYGANGSYAALQGQTGSVACSAARFGNDPAPGVTKSCFINYGASTGTPTPPPPPPPSASTPPATATSCGTEGQVCSVPTGSTATVWFGTDTRWTSRTGITGSVPCGVATFGDPAVGASKTCRYQVTSAPPANTTVVIPAIAAPFITAGSTATYTPALNIPGAVYSWNFGDGSASTAEAASPNASRQFANAGVYTVTLSVRLANGPVQQKAFLQAVGNPATARAGVASTALAVENRAGASPRLWVANPDNDSVSVIDTANNARVGEVAVGRSPRAVALAGDGRVWVSNKDSASISIINPVTLAVVQTVSLPAASRPHGLAFAPGGSAFVVLEGAGRLLKLDPVTGGTQGNLVVGPNVRHVSLSGDGASALVPRFITPTLPGESTAVVNTATLGGEVVVVNAGPMTINRIVTLRHSDKVDTEAQGAGVPNYLGAAAIAPDGRSAWVPSKQDNIKRGTLRNAQALNFQNTVRAISSRIDLGTLTEDYGRRIDHDNASLGAAALFHPNGAYLFVALETSRQVAINDALTGRQLARVDVGLAPQSLAVTPNGRTLAVQNFMGRSVSIVDLSALVNNGELTLPVAANVGTVTTERLAANVLQGKRLFYDARDPRLARDSYMSCASCHSDAGHDGRTWDFTGFGEGLRNTPALKGRAGMAQGFVHWSANFDEIQDFEGQIRTFSGGTGLMPDATFNTGTRNTPLGDRKAGLSADLDALAAYLSSLNTFDASPNRNPDGTLNAAALAGRTVFANANCASCHAGTAFASSGDANALRNIGTIKASSGRRLNGTLAGIDPPTLRDVWQSAPYLHDGSAATLAAAVQAHQGNTVAGADLTNLVAYLEQIGSQEATAPGVVVAPPAAGTGTGLSGAYFANRTLTGTPVLTRTEVPQFDWGVGAPAPGVPADNFSVRWSGQVQALEAGNYQFRTLGDDGVRVWVNGVQIINDWVEHPPTEITSPVVTLAAGQRVSIMVEYFDGVGGAVMRLSWLRPGGTWAAIPAAQLYPAGVTPPPPTTAPPANAVACANEGGSCVLPAGATATVWYGAGTQWTQRTGLTGSVVCSNAAFADPAPGAAKSCRYLVTSTVTPPPAGNRAPTVLLTAPANNASVAQGSAVTLSATATDSDGTVARVEFYAGNTLLNTDTAAPFSFVWNGAAPGTYTLTARAVDNAGTATTSGPVTLTVTAAPPPPAAGTGTGLSGAYFANRTLTGTPVLTRTEVPQFDWGVGAPAPGVPADNFSVRWSGQVQALEAGNYQFRTLGDDGVRVWVNGVQIINDWVEHPPTEITSPVVTLAAGQRVSIVVEYFDGVGGAVMRLSWLRPGGTWVPIPAAQLYPAGGVAPPPPPPPLPTNRAPTVSLTAPATNTSVAQGTAVTINATAADADGTVARVEFYAGNTLLNTDTAAPFSFVWNGAAAGTYTLTARAVDNAGAVTTSGPVTLTVTGTPPPAAQVWVRCASQNGLCTVPGTTTVRYINPALGQNTQRPFSIQVYCMPIVWGLPFDNGGTGYCEYLRP